MDGGRDQPAADVHLVLPRPDGAGGEDLAGRVPDVGQADAAADGLAPGAGGHLAIALIGAIYYLVVGRTKAFAPIVTPAEDDAPLAGSGAPLAPGGTTPPSPPA